MKSGRLNRTNRKRPGSKWPSRWRGVMLVRRGQFENTSGVNAIKLGGPASYGSDAVSKRIHKIDQILDLWGMRVRALGSANGCHPQELAHAAESLCGPDPQIPP